MVVMHKQILDLKGCVRCFKICHLIMHNNVLLSVQKSAYILPTFIESCDNFASDSD